MCIVVYYPSLFDKLHPFYNAYDIYIYIFIYIFIYLYIYLYIYIYMYMYIISMSVYLIACVIRA